MRKIFALDVDGVLLDYNQAYANMYEELYGLKPFERHPHAYHAYNRWALGLPFDEAHEFKQHFSRSAWRNMPAMDGALEACLLLEQDGFDLVCVSSVSEEKVDDRLHNLKSLGFPIKELYAAGLHHDHNPKLEIINKLKPSYFADDLALNFQGLDSNVKCILIDSQAFDSPNKNSDVSMVHANVRSLSEYVEKHIYNADLTIY